MRFRTAPSRSPPVTPVAMATDTCAPCTPGSDTGTSSVSGKTTALSRIAIRARICGDGAARSGDRGLGSLSQSGTSILSGN